MIYSLTPFNDELDLLEIRLAELDRVVGEPIEHVIAEAKVTHAGDPKPLHLQRHWERFEPWHDKIRHVVIEDMPQGAQVVEPRKLMEESDSDSWRRERWQRQSLVRGLGDCLPGDVILLSDLDEIPHPDVFESAIAGARGLQIPAPRLAMHVGTMRWRWPKPICGIARFFTASALAKADWDLEAVRFAHPLEFDREGEAAGWHLAYFGGVNAVKRKLASNAHHELDRPPFNSPAHIASCLLTGDDLFDRPQRAAIASPEGEWPPYVVANRDRFAHLL